MRSDKLPSLYIPYRAFPAAEQGAISHIDLLVRELDSYIRRFEATLELFKYANSLLASMEAAYNAASGQEKNRCFMAWMMSPVKEWPHIAARDSSLTIYHFGKTLFAIQSQDCPTLRSYVKPSDLRLIRNLFESRFPHWQLIRHAVAHSAEGIKTPQKLSLNTYTSNSPFTLGSASVGGNSRIFCAGDLHGETYVWTWAASTSSKAQIVSTECSEKALSQLVDIRMQVHQAFIPACEYASQCLQEQAAKTDPKE